MSTDKIDEPMRTIVNQCRLCGSFSQIGLVDHYKSDSHFVALIKFIQKYKDKFDNASINVAMSPLSNDESSSRNAVVVEGYSLFIKQLSNIPPEVIQLVDTNTSSTFNRIYNNSNDSVPRSLICQMDREQNIDLNLQALQQEQQLSSSIMNNLLTQSTISSIANSSQELNQDTSSADEKSTIEYYKTEINVLETKLFSTPETTDGYLIWHIDKISDKIQDAISRKKSFIDSPVFQTSMCGHKLRARLYLNGKNDPKFLSIYVYLNLTYTNAFIGNITFILVDQSKNLTLQHIKHCCSGEIKDIGSYLGFDNFADKNLIHKDENFYVLNDSIYILVVAQQTNEQKYVNLSRNIQDALEIVIQSQ